MSIAGLEAGVARVEIPCESKYMLDLSFLVKLLVYTYHQDKDYETETQKLCTRCKHTICYDINKLT